MSSTNMFKTFLLLGGLTLLFIWLGGLMGGQSGMMTAFLIACLMNAEALLKLETWKGRSSLETHPATAHLFIVNPLKADAFMKLFSTHPPIQERVEKLRAMAR